MINGNTRFTDFPVWIQALVEQAEGAAQALIDDILDDNKKPDAKRKLTLTVDFVGNPSRREAKYSVASKVTLAPCIPFDNLVGIGVENGHGKIVSEQDRLSFRHDETPSNVATLARKV